MRMQRQGRSITVDAPAKLNLFLELLGRRPDGFHELESLFVSIGLYDTLVFESSDSGTIDLAWGHRDACVPATLPLDERNLIMRAARLLQQHTGCDSGVRIQLNKRIPTESGLGGGSSDAAATLVGLNQLWNLRLDGAEIHQLASQLGSDLNFFLDSPIAALCRGRGELVEPVFLSAELPFVIVKPPSGCSTAEIFRRVTLPDSPRSAQAMCAALQAGQRHAAAHQIYNALQAPACTLNSEIGGVLQVLRRLGVVTAGMTGSGSACFGLCHSVRQARRLTRQLRTMRIGNVFSVKASI